MKFTLLLLSALFSLSIYSQDTNFTLNGNLGLGTTPENKLDVNGDSKMDGKLTVTDKTTLQGTTEIEGGLKISSLQGAEDGYVLLVGDDGNVVKMGITQLGEIIRDKGTCDTSSGDARWVYDEDVIHTCPYDSKVGIGTSTPEFELDVNGTARINSDLIVGGSNELSNYNISSTSSSSESGLKINLTSSTLKHALSISSNNTSLFDIYNNGSIVTQVTDESWAALQIKNPTGTDIFRVNALGHLTCTKIEVRMAPFPDYVFEKDYKLMSLIELDEYIQKNKHLPNMPSSTEVEKNGADLGEINRVLVEKTEEQALYLIQHEERITSLESKIKTLLIAVEKLKSQN